MTMFMMQHHLQTIHSSSRQYVHQGDVPAQIATTFVNRYSGWGNATETAIQITKAILEKAQTVNQAVDEAASRVAGEEAQSKR